MPPTRVPRVSLRQVPANTPSVPWSFVLPSSGPTNVFPFLGFSARPSAMPMAGILGSQWILSELYCPIRHLLISEE